jgi:Fic family protein
MSYEPFPAFADWKVDFDPSVVDRHAARMHAVKASATPEVQARALEVATRYAAVDTGAIEGLYTTDRGFTETIAAQSQFWERALDLRGESVKRSIQDALNGYDYVLDAVTGSVPITAKWIRELHAVLTEHQETVPVVVANEGDLRQEDRPFPHGEYKRLPNNPVSRTTGRIFHYASPEETPAEMARLVLELRCDAFQRAHPVVQAAYAHYAYVRVHPFTDGNGRVARALASVFLYRSPGVPLVVFADQRGAYIDALESADAGRPGAFVRFIAERVIDTVDLIRDAMMAPPDEPALTGDRIRRLAAESNERLVASAERLSALALQFLQEEIDKFELPMSLDVTISGRHVHEPSVEAPDGYKIVPVTGLWAAVQLPSGFRKMVFEVAAVRTLETAPELLVVADGVVPPLEVWLREIDPTAAMTLDIKLRSWARSAARSFAEFIESSLEGRQGS